MDAMTTTLRNRLFLKGIIFGGIFGLLVGSLVAFQVSAARVDTIKGSMVMWRRRKKAPDYSKLLV
ncbi:MAG TPA: hypothetical protein VKB76_06830 [Ktedonobacterales bacterium]|nr:hypothetical protein [Ktedonobacterales bacterium]